MRWTFKRKLFLAFSAAGLMMLANAGVAYWANLRAEVTKAGIIKTAGLLDDLDYLVAYMNGVTSAQRSYMLTGNENAIAGIPKMRRDAAVVIERVRATIAGNTEQEARFGQYQVYLKQRVAFINALNTTRKTQGFEAAKALFETGVDDRLLPLMLDQFQLMKITTSSQLKAQQTADRLMQQRILWTEGSGFLLALALLTVTAITFSRSISRNVQISVDLVSAMAKKDLSGADGVPATDDELAVAIQAINIMKRAMAEALTEVALSSALVAASGAEIQATAREIAETTHTEQKKVEQFASSVAEMNASVRGVAEHADVASRAANDAVASATSGRALVRQTHDAMHRINTSVTTASADISKLGEETQSIGEVVRIIQDIAGQTNLLALNAAIEAARAGDQGKGFAVVAQEVRMLAERTTRFTEKVAEKIQSVQEGARRVVDSMRQGEIVVLEGVAKFNQVTASLDAIVERIESAQRGITMIATASTQQAAATEGLTEDIHAISVRVTQTTQQLDQTATACTELAGLASVLRSVVDAFKLPAEKRTARVPLPLQAAAERKFSLASVASRHRVPDPALPVFSERVQINRAIAPA